MTLKFYALCVALTGAALAWLFGAGGPSSTAIRTLGTFGALAAAFAVATVLQEAWDTVRAVLRRPPAPARSDAPRARAESA